VAGLVLAGVVTAASPAAFAQRRGGERREVATEDKELTLAVGENKTLTAQGVKQYTEGTPGIVDVRLTPDSSKFIVVGQKPGTTTLLLINDDGTQTNYTINVFSRSPEVVEKELGELLEGYTGLRVRRVGSRLFIEGGVANKGDLERVKQIAELYGGQVESLVTLGSGSIDRKLNIRIDFFFVQYNRDSSYGVGISYPSRIGGEVIQSEFGYDFVSQAQTARAAVVNQPLPGLDIASRNGWAKVMKQATVITTNGNEAMFKSGGEVNVPVSSGFAAAIEKIQFGTNVTVLPRYDPKTKNLEVKVTADVADLTPAQETTLPGRQTSELSTLVFLKLGQSLVLSGIKSQGQRHNIRGIPFFSQIPVLGVFFGTHGDQQEDIEGAVFIVPSVVESSDKDASDMIEDALKQFEDFDGDLDDVEPYRIKIPLGTAPPAELEDDAERATPSTKKK
jgi:pilus assembly protein CpaC